MIRIVVPMGGEGKKFIERGYTFPKPLVEIGRKPLIEYVVNNVKPLEPHRFIFVCRHEHVERFALKEVLQLIAPQSDVISMDQPTAGALCSVLLAIEHVGADDELLIANADQYVDEPIDRYLAAARAHAWDGYIMTFPSTHPKWSYVKLERDQVIAVVEKRPISRIATVGLYYFRRAGDFIKGAEQMLVKNATVAGEFFVAPVYNELILMGKRIGIHAIKEDQMHSLGTPEDVDAFIAARLPSLLK